MNATKLENILIDAIKNREQLLIVGQPAIGKTEIIKSVCQKVGAKLIVSHPAVSDPTDYKGLPVKNHDGTHAEFLPFGDTWEAINTKELTVWFVDDLGQSSNAVQKALMQLLLGRRLNGHKISDNVVFIGATNDIGQRAGVTGLLEPVKSRWDSIINLEPDIDSWCNWAIDNDMPFELIAFLRSRPELLSQFEPTKALINHPSPRTWASVGKRLKRGVTDFDLFKGAVGKGSATELLAFLEMAKDAPDLDAILLNPKTTPIPDKSSLKYLVATGLAIRAKKDNFHRVFKYLHRLPVPFKVLAIRDAIRKNIELTKTEVYIKWICKEGKELIGI